MIISEVQKSKKSIPDTISYLLNKIFNIKTDVNDIRAAFLEMKLSDVLNLNNAFDNKDENMVRQILGGYINEYAMPGRATIKSSAPSTQKNVQQPLATNTQKNQTTPTSDTNVSGTTPSKGTLSATELTTKNEIDDKEKEQQDLQAELDSLKKSAGIA